MKRPIGVWIIGILALVGAVIEILAGLSALGVGGLQVSGVLGNQAEVGGGAAIGAGVVLLIIGFLYLVFAISFLGLKRWAWAALLIVQIVAIVAVILQMAFDGFYWSSLGAIIIPLIIVFYLTRKRVRQAFTH